MNFSRFFSLKSLHPAWMGIFWVWVFLMTGCAQSSSPALATSAAATQCNPGVAAIGVGDGFLQILCGCTGQDEKAGTVFSGSTVLTCHVTAQATVFFYFLGTALQHQIISTGTPSFGATPLSDPNSSYPIRVHAVTLTQTATTYAFKDNIGGMQGQLIVP